MPGCSYLKTTQILVGIQSMGILGLPEVLEKVDESGVTERQAIVDFMIEQLKEKNYIPTNLTEPFRTALWREYKRHIKEDITHLFSEIDVTVRGDPGKQRDRFVRMLKKVFGEHELKPLIAFEQPEGKDIYPQLLLRGDPIIKGCIMERTFKLKIKKYLSHW